MCLGEEAKDWTGKREDDREREEVELVVKAEGSSICGTQGQSRERAKMIGKEELGVILWGKESYTRVDTGPFTSLRRC